MAKMELTQFQLLEDFKAAKSLDEVHDLLGKAEGFRDAPGSFQANKEKEKKDRELRKQQAGMKLLGLGKCQHFVLFRESKALFSQMRPGFNLQRHRVCCFFCTHLTEDTWLTTWNV